MRGFSIVLKRRIRRLRRKVRDSYKGRRGRRRRYAPLTPRQAVLLKTHWSEGKELRGFRRFGKRHYRSFVKKFLTIAPKLFSAVYGQRQLGFSSKSRRTVSAYNKLVFNYASTNRILYEAQQNSPALLLPALTIKKQLARWKLRCMRRRRTKTALLTRRKLAALLRQRSVTRGVQKIKQALVAGAVTYAGHDLVDTLPERDVAGPLYFQNPTSKVIKSAGAKAKELEANIASKEARFKLTAQYVENLTRFLPELINYMVSKRTTKQRCEITSNTVRHLIRNIY